MVKFCLGKNLFLTLYQEINWSCYLELCFAIHYTVPNFSAFAYVTFACTYFFPLFMLYVLDLMEYGIWI
jgi:hypothetical protein